MKKIILLLIFILLSPNASAELIYLKSGEVIRGKIIKITPVYVRTERRKEDTRREFLVEDIEKITHDPTIDDQISALAIQNLYLKANSPTQKELRDAAMEKAQELIQEALKNLEVNALKAGSSSVNMAVQEKATALITETIKQANVERLDQAPEAMKNVAFEVANTLIEEAMKNAQLQQMDKLSQNMQVTAQEQISAIVDVAVKNAEVEVQKVVSEKVQAIAKEQATQVAQAAINKVEEISASITSPEEPQPVAKEVVLDILPPPEVPPVVTQAPVEVPEAPEPIPSSFQEAVERVEEAAQGPEQLAMKAESPIATEVPMFPPAEETAPEIKIEEAIASAPEPEPVPSPMDDLPYATEEIAEPMQEEYVEVVEEEVEEKKGLSSKMIWILIAIIASFLPLILRRKSLPKAPGAKKGKDNTLQVTTSFVYSYLPDDLGAKLTQEDISLIVEYEAKIRQEHAAENPTKENINQYVFDKIKDLMPRLTVEDVGKVLDIKDKFAQ